MERVEGVERSPLVLCLAGLPRAAAQTHMRFVARHGLSGVRFDAAAPDTRARDLDRSARRDLAATLRRNELALAGADLWIPSAHFASGEHADRAIGAVADALGLLRELESLLDSGVSSGLSLGVTLPEAPAQGVVEALRAAADTSGVALAVEGRVGDEAWPGTRGFDPASALLAGEDPVQSVLALGDRLVCARLSDASDAQRVEVGGSGAALDATAYGATLHAAGYLAPVAIDTRGLVAFEPAVDAAVDTWRGAGP